jgi:phosphodiesterase/alkaline phosphatase D-like protein
MARLLLGPLLRYVDEDTATVWVETDAPSEAEVRCDVLTGAGGSTHTFQVGGHHYALITVVGLEPGSETPYRVLLDGEQVWPLADDPFPPSTIRTLVPDGAGTLNVAFGSCRWATRPADNRHDRVGPDALDALALRAVAGGDRPDVLLLLGDQVYADETSEALRERLGRRRDLSEPPHGQVADYEEYTTLYHESWLDPEVRWLLSTVPSCMIFDDHDLIDDWNTSAAWQRDVRALPWWSERVVGGLASYWVYQHLGNLSPGELAEDPLFNAVRSVNDGTEFVRKFAAQADDDLASVRWSYRRDFGRVRMVMVDSRAARVLQEDRRSMLDDGEWQWLRRQLMDDRGAYDHLLLGSSLPWLLPHGIHATEAWDAALCAGARGERWARVGEKLRRAGDLEHWAAFPGSFHDLARLVEEAGKGAEAPATICVLSGDVHHAYVAEPRFDRPTDAHVLQLTCSPLHNSVPALMRIGFRVGWSALGKWIGRLLSRHARIDRPPITWRRTGGPWFGNHLMTLTLRGRSARLRMDRARKARGGGVRLTQVLERALGRGA